MNKQSIMGRFSNKNKNNSKCRISAYEPKPRNPLLSNDTNHSNTLLSASQRRLNKWGNGVVIEPEESYYRNMAASEDTEERRNGSRRKKKFDQQDDEEEDDYDDSSPTKDPSLKYADYDPDKDVSITSDDVYIVRQNWGFFSIFFSLAQSVILGLMMFKCGIAPLQINPMFGPYPDVLSEWGAKNSVLILEHGESWRLITPIVLHAGVIHLLGNVLVQLETGVFFEKEWGSIRWLIVFLVSGVGSSMLSVIIKPDALSVGSSGAIMGLFGAKLSEIVLRACERVRNRQDKVGQQVRKEQCCAVSFSVILIMLFSFIPYVDWAAHLGGLVTGIFVGIVIFAWEIESWLWKILWSLLGSGLTLISFAAAISYMYSGLVVPNEALADVCAYYQNAMGEDNYECTCQR